jgi:phosphoribosylformylglycinamidine (FGAM) synthase-like amidotransferase family enzyme
VTRDRPTIAVVVFPGSNDDRDAALALEALGADPVLVWHAEDRLPGCEAVVLPGASPTVTTSAAGLLPASRRC